MSDKWLINNLVEVKGEIVTRFEYSHTVFGEGFYRFELLVERTSQEVDVIPVLISERIINVEEDMRCERVTIKGQFRSYHAHEGEKTHLKLSVFVKDIEPCRERISGLGNNEIYLDGYLCRKPNYRTTPTGKEISDMMIAVNRENGKSDYIPCICWGRNAKYMAQAEVGKHIQVWGRIQSREYVKKDEKLGKLMRMAYEVSVNKLT